MKPPVLPDLHPLPQQCAVQQMKRAAIRREVSVWNWD